MPVHTNIHTNCLNLLRGSPYEKSLTPYLFHRSQWASFTVCLVWDTSSEGHKYIAAHTQRADFIVGLPLSLIELHKNILEIVVEATGDIEAYCPGGGYLSRTGDHFSAFSESQDFGPWDHTSATSAFNSIVLQR